MISGDDKKKALQELGNIPEELYDEFVEEFRSQFKRQMEEIRCALKAGDLLMMRESAHSLSGTSGNLRLYPVHRAAKALEISLKESQPREVVESNFKALENIFLQGWSQDTLK